MFSGSEAEIPVLVLVWSQDEPERVGELVAPPRAQGLWFTVGRAVEPGEDGAFPLSFQRLRPYSREDTGPLRSSRISRRQLRLRNAGEDGFDVEQVGRPSLRVNGNEVQSAQVRPGDVIEVERRFTLLCALRPRSWPRRATSEIEGTFPFGQVDGDGLCGESPAVWALRARIAQVAARDEHALILGPSGAGKELVARAIHRRSRRAAAPLISRNAATIPESLIDAELFGNLKNYPNPGTPEREGLLGGARGGTLFLDEIGELPIALQAHLLRVLDGGEYQRLGEVTVRRADARVIAATNRDPQQLKHDLLARFGHRVEIPGLDERVEDVPLILRHLARAYSRDDAAARARLFDGDEPRFAAELVHALLARAFVAHVREVSEVLLRALESEGPRIQPPPGITPRRGPAPPAAIDPEALTREEVLVALERADQVRERAWRELGLRNRYQFRRLLRRLGIE
ncbi:MAG: sigma 54-interacting transcriptional regulator [Nannocystaceae bacterium]